MRALVASLEAALAFVRALAGAVPVLTQLLASSTVSDVHDAIGLLISYSKFGIDGAPAALRKMLPLVFSLDQGEQYIENTTCSLRRLFSLVRNVRTSSIAYAGLHMNNIPPAVHLQNCTTCAHPAITWMLLLTCMGESSLIVRMHGPGWLGSRHEQ